MTAITPITLLDLAPVIDRLGLLTAQGVKFVGSAADGATAAAAGRVIASPTLYVLFLGAVPYEVREGSGPLRQGFDVMVGVIVGVTLAGTTGSDGLKAIQAPAALVRGALFGWEHPQAETQFRSAGESIEDFDEKTRVFLYRLDFTCRVRIQET